MGSWYAWVGACRRGSSPTEWLRPVIKPRLAISSGLSLSCLVMLRRCRGGCDWRPEGRQESTSRRGEKKGTELDWQTGSRHAHDKDDTSRVSSFSKRPAVDKTTREISRCVGLAGRCCSAAVGKGRAAADRRDELREGQASACLLPAAATGQADKPDRLSVARALQLAVPSWDHSQPLEYVAHCVRPGVVVISDRRGGPGNQSCMAREVDI